MKNVILYRDRLNERKIAEALSSGVAIATGSRRQISQRAAGLELGAFDVDGVITYIGQLNGRRYHVSWTQIKEILGEEAAALFRENYEWWKSQPPSVEASVRWNDLDAKVYRKARLRRKQVFGALTQIPLMGGIDEFLKLKEKYGLRYAAISFGLRENLEAHGLVEMFDRIHACSFVFNRNGYVVAIASETVDQNKGEKLEEFAAHYEKSPENVFAVGDSIHDLPMEKAAGIAAHAYHSGYDGHHFNYKQEIGRLFDELPEKGIIFPVSDSIAPVAKTLDYLISQARVVNDQK